MNLFDRVRLISDKYQDLGVLQGDEGTVVDIYASKEDGQKHYEIEFFNWDSGIDRAIFALSESDIELIIKPKE